LSKIKKYEQVRDAFCFACTTGLRYSDLAQLKREHIKEDEIILTVKKTKERLSIPLTPYSRAILDKYRMLRKPLPIISNQKMNYYLKGWDEKNKSGKVIKKHKGICELAGINEPVEIVRYRGAKREANIYPKYELVGVHTGRKTFATLSLEKGMSAEEVMSITGHKDYKSFKRYVKITEQRKKVVMLKAWRGEKKTETIFKAI
jgi:integrase